MSPMERIQAQNRILLDALFFTKISQDHAASIMKNELMFDHGILPRLAAS